MTQAHELARALNAVAKSPQFANAQARATARKDRNVDPVATKRENDGFNPDVDGCESFVMRDGSVCAWQAARRTYVARA